MKKVVQGLTSGGHEWMRAKWSAPIRKYWKISEQMMVKYSDLVICDSVNIEKYIHECYDHKGIKGRNPKTTFIAYGADLTLSELADDDAKLVNWYTEKGFNQAEEFYNHNINLDVFSDKQIYLLKEFCKMKSASKIKKIECVIKNGFLKQGLVQIIGELIFI